MTGPSDEFRASVLENLGPLRAFSRSLEPDPSKADDYVQEALLRAWEKHAQFQPGTNIRAWLFTILRNAFFSSKRRSARETEDPDEALQLSLSTPAAQQSRVEFNEFLVAFHQLSPEHREALTLVGASGCSYAEAAEIADCAVGTIKSRVNRARSLLKAALKEDALCI